MLPPLLLSLIGKDMLFPQVCVRFLCGCLRVSGPVLHCILTEALNTHTHRPCADIRTCGVREGHLRRSPLYCHTNMHLYSCRHAWGAKHVTFRVLLVRKCLPLWTVCPLSLHQCPPCFHFPIFYYPCCTVCPPLMCACLLHLPWMWSWMKSDLGVVWTTKTG